MPNKVETAELNKLRKHSKPIRKQPAWLRILLVCLSLIIIVISVIAILIFANNLNRPNYLTKIVQQHVVHKDFFTSDKVIKTSEQNDFNPTADGEIGGLFRLSQSEIQTLLKYKQLITCNNSEKCQPHQASYTTVGQYCDSTNSLQKRSSYMLCVDPSDDQAVWTVDFY
jgi:hypothetical protein